MYLRVTAESRMQSGSNVVEILAAAHSKIESDAISALLVPFDDHELVDEMRSALGARAKIDVITKNSLAGRSPKAILPLLRARRYDLLIASNRSRQVLRPMTSLKLLAAFGKARTKIVIDEEGVAYRYSPVGLWFHLLPRLAVGGLGIFFLILFAYVSLPWYRWQFRKPPKVRRPVPRGWGEYPRIAFLRTDLAGELKIGGSVTHIRGVTKALSQLGHPVFFVANRPLASTEDIGPSYEVRELSLVDWFDEALLLDFNFRLARKSRRIFRKEKPDLIYQRHSVLNFSGALLSQWWGAPLVLEVNGSEVWVKEHWSRLVLKGIARAYEQIAFSAAHLIVVVSEALREQLIKLGVPEQKILVNPNGVDLEEFRPDIDGSGVRKQFGIKKDRIVVGFVGTFTRWHGVHVLVEAGREALKEKPNLHFLLIGDGPMRGELEEEVKSAEGGGLDRHFTFAGLVAHEKIPEHLAACDILVSPHVWDENPAITESMTPFFGSPTKLFEYMAMGKAIVASRVGQISEIFSPGRDAILVEPGNVAQISEAIQKLAAHPRTRKALGRNARRKVIENFTWLENAKR
ncbi:MAG: glycosyltransferase family 4 protein, partial [Bacteroidota bacterium]